MFKVSQSKINTARRCLKAYDYKYIQRLKKRVKARPLQFGSIVHDMMEAQAGGHDPLKLLDKIAQDNKKLFREEREVYGEIIDDIRYIWQAYNEYYAKEPLQYLKHGKQRAEHQFAIEIDRDIIATGKIDAAIEAKRMEWLLEHKTHKQFPNQDHRWRNLQSSVYIRFVDMLGWWDLEGTMWNYIRSKAPTRPQLLKSGEMSTRELDSLPQVVIDTLKQHKKNPKKYADLIDAQRRNMSTYFQRIFTPVKKAVVDNLYKDFVSSARQLMDINFRKGVPRSIGRHCDWCEFELLCRAALQGSDEAFVKEREYVIKKNEDQEIVEETID